MSSDLSEEDLRLRYLDWCSARVARRFLELSLDEVWLRSDHASSLPGDSRDTPSVSAESLAALGRIPDYLELVRKTASLLADEMNLPDFSKWREEYLTDPATFDQDLLGR